jgi:hypothetical protein
MSAIQLSFSLRASSSVKTVHLIGSWDNYSGQLPLSKDKEASKSGSWKGTFRFQGSTLQPGQRYWYYYIVDGYHVSHDPKVASTVEPTTNRTLNILDVPSDKSSKSSSDKSKKHSSKSSRSSKRPSIDVAKGRPLSASQIQSPKPIKPNQTKHLVEADYLNANYSEPPTVEQLTSRFSTTTIGDDYDSEFCSSPPSSVGSSLSSRSDSSSPSSLSSISDYSTSSVCTCERYGITRKGDRVKLDCGGSVCGYTEESSCSSDSCEDDYIPRSTRRQGVVIRH